MLESLRGFPSCMPSALKLASVLFIECAIIVGVGLLIARGIARVLLKAYHVRTYVRPQHYVSVLPCRDKKGEEEERNESLVSTVFREHTNLPRNDKL